MKKKIQLIGILLVTLAMVHGKLSAGSPGSGIHQTASETSAVKPAQLEVSFFQKDSVKYIKVAGTTKNLEGNLLPLAGESVRMYVPSLFRPLPIGVVTLDRNGEGHIEFPGTLIGDSLGNITVIAKIEESAVYGNVVAKNSIPWAIPKHSIQAERPSREIWTPVAPVWMIITLIIMLAGVWAHYTYAIVQLARIKRSSKQHPVQHNPEVS
jgi:hypothetical protein